jgi:hypothetical protein
MSCGNILRRTLQEHARLIAATAGDYGKIVLSRDRKKVLQRSFQRLQLNQMLSARWREQIGDPHGG